MLAYLSVFGRRKRQVPERQQRLTTFEPCESEAKMETPMHNMSSLFDQLGLPSDTEAIERFIETHGPLAPGILLADAPFWTSAQASFLREEIVEDADWAEVVDELNARLRASGS